MLNYKIHEEEVKTGLVDEKGKPLKKKGKKVKKRVKTGRAGENIVQEELGVYLPGDTKQEEL